MSNAAIPGPAGHWLIGNVGDINVDNTTESMCRLTRTHGPIWKFCLGREERIVIGSQALMDEVCDERRFTKVIAAVLKQARNGMHDGLGTAHGPEESNWGIAHRMLAPHFTPIAIESMFDDMHDIAAQLVLKWARYGPEHDIEVTDDFTRLTLDAIALSAMDCRFNSFYRESMHPFINALATFLSTNAERAKRSDVLQPFCVFENYKYWSSIEELRMTGHAVINERKMYPSKKKDMLDTMLYGVDSETGEQMTEDSVVNNMITLLFAGHETTSGLLSFTFYYLLSNPAEYVIAQKEVDDVVGNATITAAHLSRLPYLSAVLRESLRLSPTVPAIALTAKEDTILGGKYKIKAKMPIIALLAAVHRDRRVYGSDADAFRPERMLDEAFSRRNQDFPNCWKPFGNGMRGCVGRFFAQQQSLLVVALLLQSFDFSMSDPSYRLRTTQMTTVKPDGFRMRARPRQHLTPARLQRKTIIDSPQSARSTAVVDRNKAPKTVIDIFYGSNAGTCKVLANQLADHAASYGYAVGATGTLDDATEALSKRNAVVLLAASYDGQPASNAEKFVQWISTLQSNELAEVKFAVFGCGHRDWASTFLKVPTYLNETLEKRGGTRLAILGISDVAAGKVQSDFSTWETSFFWPAIRARYGAESTLQVKVYGPGTSTLRGGLRQARVLANTRLASSGLSLRKHLEVTLPPGLIYNTGDRLVVLPQNPRSVVRRALERLSLSPDSVLTISSTATTALPVDTPVRAAEVFRTYVELEQPASENDVLCLLDAVRDETSKIRLSHLANDARDLERPSVLDLLELFPAIDILPGAFLAMQPPMRLRQYCISSSPLWHPGHATVTYSVGDWSHTQASKKNIGTASTYLSSLTTADEMFVSIEKCAEEFRMPEPADDVPLILIAAGTGLGPFRGFVQERAARIAAGRILATALLFYGCRSPDDDIYSESFQRWEQLGAVCIRRAYSSVSNQSQGCRYVQDRIYHDRADFIRLLAAGARVAVCVPQCAVADVRETLISMIEDSKTTDADTPSEGARTTPTERQPKIVWHLWTPPTPSI